MTITAPGSGELGPGDVEEIAELYNRLARRLERTVRVWVRAPQPVIEDACQIAWSRLVDRSDHVRRDTVLAWLTTTAVREVLKLLSRTDREVPLDDAVESTGSLLLHLRIPATEHVVEQRERIGRLRILPIRQQRFLWLQALGLSYAEIAAHEGFSARTVERQLLRAKQRLRRDD